MAFLTNSAISKHAIEAQQQQGVHPQQQVVRATHAAQQQPVLHASDEISAIVDGNLPCS